MTPLPSRSLSLFDQFQNALGTTYPVIQCTKATLLQLSHIIEDIIMQERLPVLLLVGFQDDTYSQSELDRYQGLMQTAQLVCVFASGMSVQDKSPAPLIVALADDDPLRHEWFLLVYCHRFAALLSARERQIVADDDLDRVFDTLWSFDAGLIRQALDTLEDVIAYYRPESVDLFRGMRASYPVILPDLDLIARFMLELVHYEERLNRELNRQQRIIDTILEKINYHIYVSSYTDENIFTSIYRSPNLQQIIGFTVEQASAEPGFWINRVHPDDREKVFMHWAHLHQQKTASVSYRFTHADGRTVWVQNHEKLMTDPVTGQQVIYGVFLDITDQIEVEAAHTTQQRLQVELQAEKELSAMKSNFMSLVSHEFRTPLATILSSSELLLRYDDRITPESRQAKLHTIQAQVQHMTQMLDDMAAVIKGEQLKSQPVPLMLETFCRELIDEFITDRKAKQTIDYHFEGDDRVIRCDPTLLKPILTKLLSNAIKFSPPETVVHCRVLVRDGWLTIEVVDHGVGIPAEDQSRIFEPLFRASNAGAVGGTGLGLKIVADYVALQGGTVTCVSEVGAGAAFTVRLPIS